MEGCSGTKNIIDIDGQKFLSPVGTWQSIYLALELVIIFCKMVIEKSWVSCIFDNY